MQIVGDTQHAILAFVDACNRNHYEPTASEVQVWLESPLPREPVYETRRREKSSRAGVVGLNAPAFDRLWTTTWAEQLLEPYRDFGQQLVKAVTSSQSFRALHVSRWLSDTYQVMVEPAESAIEHLLRIGWLRYLSDSGSNDDRLQISPLGRACCARSRLARPTMNMSASWCWGETMYSPIPNWSASSRELGMDSLSIPTSVLSTCTIW